MPQQRGGRRPAGKPTGKPRTIEPSTRQTVELALKSQAGRASDHVSWLRNNIPAFPKLTLLARLKANSKDTHRIGRESGAAGTPLNAARANSAGRDTLEAAVFFVLAIAEAHESPLSELGYREDLVRSVLLARGTDHAVRVLALKTAPHLARKIVARIPTAMYQPINKVVGRDFITKSGQTGVIVIDEWAERGVGAGIGWAASATFAWWVIRASRSAFKNPDAVVYPEALVAEERIFAPDDVLERGKSRSAHDG